MRILLAVVAILVLWDAVAYQLGGQDATITQVVRDTSASWMLIPVLVGIVIGHIYWGRPANNVKE